MRRECFGMDGFFSVHVCPRVSWPYSIQYRVFMLCTNVRPLNCSQQPGVRCGCGNAGVV